MLLKDKINNKFNNKILNEKIEFPNKNLLIEITNCCNNKCIFCFNHCMKRKKKFIDENLCKRILKEAFDLGSREVGFYVTGEPLLDKRLEQFISYAKNIGFEYIYITTNGILANLDRVKKLYNSGLDSIKFSINAINANDYKFIHQTDNFETVINNLSLVYNWKINNNIKLKVYVSYIATNYTYNPINIKNFFSHMCDEVVIMKAINQGGLIPNINKLISKNINTEIDNKFTTPCNYPFNSVIVTVEGYLTACCMDFENFLAYADLNKTTLKEAWNNEVITKFRNNHLNHNIRNTICDNCIYNSYNIPNPLNKKLCVLKNYNVFCNHLENVLRSNKNGSN